MADHIEEIKSRIDLVDLVREYLQLTLSGSNYKARCPFHHEKSASFMVSAPKQIWHCFGCGEGGDLFSFFMKQEGVEFGEALRVLAQRAGVTLERSDPRIQGEKTRLTALLDLASQYYHQALLRAPAGQTAREYCARRSLDQSLIDDFRLGYALPDFEALTTFLLSRKFTLNEIIAAGLAVKKEQGYGCYDRFRDRLIIPIANIHGSVIGFAGRVLGIEDKGAKYINSPQTALYDKGRTVFGLDRTKQAIREGDACILVEGYMDFFALYVAGYRNVVATSGTALTVDQIRLIKRFTQHFLFAFDADSAGGNATMRGIELALGEGVDARVIQIPKGGNGMPIAKDPDECLKKDPDAWKSAVEEAVSFMEYSFSRIITPSALTDSFEKKKVSRALLDRIALLPDRIEQDHWIKRLANALNLSESILWEELGKKGMQRQVQETPSESVSFSKAPVTSADVLVSLLLQRPDVIPAVLQRVELEMIPDGVLRQLYTIIRDLYTASQGSVSSQDLFESAKKSFPQEHINRYFFIADTHLGALDEVSSPVAADTLAGKVKQEYIKSRMSDLESRMREAEKRNDTVAMEEAIAQFKTLQSL